MSPSRSVLFVGEGNFSFSASSASAGRRYSDCESSIITATCLQPHEQALRHEGAAANIQSIKDSGGTVLFEVDCTKLEGCSSLQGRAFDRVVFNFPHCGRKSGVKKNRELLKNFFRSCVQVLADDGEVHVSLCNGQGGTPVDQPKREWHNSWQVVAMAAEAHLVLSAVLPFESEKLQNYKCTGYRSQDKGFHVEKALLHVFTRSLPFTAAQRLEVEESIDGKKVHYIIPTELSDYVFRSFLSSDSLHPVKLVQDYLLKGLSEKWSVSMTMETSPFLLTAKQRQTCLSPAVDSTQCYRIKPLQKDVNPDSDEADDVRSTLRSSRCFDDTEREGCYYVLRPSLVSNLKEFLMNRDEGGEDKHVECSAATVLFGTSGLVFRNVSIGPWSMPAFHQLLLTGSGPIKDLGQDLETLLAPFGVTLLTKQDGLCLTAQPMGSVGHVFSTHDNDRISVTASLNLDLLAVLLFSLPDWRVLWSRDQRFLDQYSLRPSPGAPYRPFVLFPEHFSFDVSFWTGPTWEEKRFHGAVREASCGTVQQVKLIDRFSHPDLSQTSYCYRLVYHSHTHALSHTQALKFHKHLEHLLTDQLHATIR
ncbi:ferredoxin-fold anticodon-binding domain-containing protein 1 [Gouania willdenowi]|uniref:FDX-ACB domain-containing protein n=1 Tax=Gouania willdenowi TaxID=441366 RepID=A0A8C5HJP6_GOUWI|nr:ferredoxin-fold anticodon-binding domain-containing protein 1 [Gouania willdenowi]